MKNHIHENDCNRQILKKFVVLHQLDSASFIIFFTHFVRIKNCEKRPFFLVIFSKIDRKVKKKRSGVKENGRKVKSVLSLSLEEET